MAATKFSAAPEAQAIGAQLIAQHHPHLEGVRVEYRFISKTPRKGERDVWGTARKITGLNAHLFLNGPAEDGDEYEDTTITISCDTGEVQTTGAALRVLADGLHSPEFAESEDFFLIVLSHPIWLHLTGQQKIALVDHELEHCKVEDTGEGLRLYLQGHDVEEFSAIIKRHGLWREDVRDFNEVIQGVLFESEGLKVARRAA